MEDLESLKKLPHYGSHAFVLAQRVSQRASDMLLTSFWFKPLPSKASLSSYAGRSPCRPPQICFIFLVSTYTQAYLQDTIGLISDHHDMANTEIKQLTQYFFLVFQMHMEDIFTLYCSLKVCNSTQFSSVAQSCPTLCDPMNRSTPGLPVHHQLPESTQTHVHRVGDAIQPSHPLSSPSPPAPNPSQHQGLFQ